MATFRSKADVSVCLHSEAGEVLGYANFRKGLWIAETDEQAAAMRRALPLCREWAVTEIDAPQEPAAELQADAEDKPRPDQGRKKGV
jgi:hypothetical protein